MNLIEQLGGYEKAKDHRDYLIDFGNEFNRPNKYEVNKINNALLEYRRQHNIFEVGDDVVFDAHFCDEHKGSGYGKITYCTMDKRVFEIDSYYLVSIAEIQHATDAEIKAGKRLEVKSEN